MAETDVHNMLCLMGLRLLLDLYKNVSQLTGLLICVCKDIQSRPGLQQGISTAKQIGFKSGDQSKFLKSPEVSPEDFIPGQGRRDVGIPSVKDFETGSDRRPSFHNNIIADRHQADCFICIGSVNAPWAQPCLLSRDSTIFQIDLMQHPVRQIYILGRIFEIHVPGLGGNFG